MSWRYRYKDPRMLQQRRFRCTVCGTVLDMPKKYGRTHIGHIKTAWCYGCKAVSDFIQIGE